MLRIAGWMRIRKTIWSAAVLAAVPALAACSSAPPPPPPPTTIQLTVVGAKALNPDPNGRPSPVMLRLYQLGPSDAFANADFFQVIDQDKATLGPTLLDRQELAVPPDSRQTVTVQPKPDVKTLAVAAAFRAYEEAGWRAMQPIQPNKANSFVLTATASTITLVPGDGANAGTDAPADAKAEDAKPEAEKPEAEKPAGDKPSAEKPNAEKPDATPKPAADQPPAATHNLILKGAS
ncbi:type VI secretion system lipoprotein TssJ [Azospirillum sp.]|uniref:type VI secretion system lipoprotein TssJ n=1 Tax=Azospirillum sp. TaxID=34012 RepID=UPI002D266B47|nr:type VI secretion system lipoprotein TssJ [Azospirillum sp.]HYF90324.1 type VI secretion system lipoprotein TssJ [Azospirillum sp.]